MKLSDFDIGTEFFTAAGKWRCTDVGTRTVIAISLNGKDASWFEGPPYAVAECVFDEYDIDGMSRSVRDVEPSRPLPNTR